MIDGNSPKWRHRVLLNCAENLKNNFDGAEQEALVALFSPDEQVLLRREIRGRYRDVEDRPAEIRRDVWPGGRR